MTEVTRRELAAFLRSRRERLSPAAAGLAAHGRRRTPGLRREEVAQLAGVGVTWYTWLEQARPINVSAQVLCAVARALQLLPDERRHLMRLGGFPVVDPVADAAGVVTEAHLAMLTKLLPYPVAIQTDRFDLLAYNRTYRYLIDDVEKWPAHERNCALLVFLDPAWRERYLDFDKVAASVVARLRASMVSHADDPEWTGLVERLRSESPRFERHWQRHDVAFGDRSERGFRNDRVGLLRVNFTGMWLDAARSVRMVSLVPTDELTASRLRDLDEAVAQEAAVLARPLAA